MSQPAPIFWITGLAGAGKSTVARLLWQRLRDTGQPAVFLDGDELRAAVADDLGHSRSDRLRAAMRHGRACQLLADQGIPVVCATISLFHEVQRWNRANLPGYREIYLRVPLSELQRRDPKGIYARAGRGEVQNVVGLDIAAEEPEAPDLVIDNHGPMSFDAAVAIIWDRFALPNGRPVVAPTSAPAVSFGSKAETLERLVGRLRHGRVLPQIRFSVADWRRDRQSVIAGVAGEAWGRDPMIVRSSARGEDGAQASQAGKYLSVADVGGVDALAPAVDRVIGSFGEGDIGEDQIFVQPMLQNVSLAGVAFTRDPSSGGPYLVINYDDTSRRTDRVTSGTGDDLKTFYCVKYRRMGIPATLVQAVHLLDELEVLLGCDALDVEFAVADRVLYLLQVRPAVIAAQADVDRAAHEAAVGNIARKVELLRRPHPFLHGTGTVFGVMPDWNPAEIVGLRPRPLALSLYRELVTDAIWAYQRDNYGYKNLRSFPLLISFEGLPYIDVRVSFNSFLPADIDGDLAERLVNHYIDRLLARPNLHDKVEFEIIFSCYTLDLPERLKPLLKRGFSEADLGRLADSLRGLTNRIIHGETGLWRKDREKIDVLAARLPTISDARIDKISRIYWLLEDCKRYGTLPFAGLARAGFIAVQLLRSLVSAGVLDEAEYVAFMANLDTVGSRIGHDFAHLPKQEFLGRYGHLRPGTYDILSPRYDEEPDRYFDWSAARANPKPPPRFALSVDQLRRIERLLKEHRLEHDVLGFMDFIKAGIEGREYAKFVFTRSLSDALSLIKKLGEDHGIPAEDCAYIDLAALRSLYGQSGSVASWLKESVADGRRRHALTRSLVLPPLITQPDDVWAFHLPATHPNYVTQTSVTGAVVQVDDPPERLAGAIVFIPSADPGFDWIFTRGIAGFVTQFGGVNSHMAIRAGELGIPAAIGVGEALYRTWGGARRLCLDCASRQVQVLQ